MFDSQRIAELAAELQQAQTTRKQVEHFSKRFPGMTIEDGYRVSRAWVALQLAQGRYVIGHKIGLTSRAMQQASQIDEPDYGTLLDNMLYTCTPGQTLDIAYTDFVVPRVEVELAFVLKKDLQGPNVSVEEVLAATEYVTPAIVLGITHGLHQLRSLLGCVHHGDQQSFGTQIQILFDQSCIAHWHTRNGVVHWIGSDRLQLLLDALQIIGRMFTIDQQPIKTRHGAHFGGVTAGHAHPQTNLGLLFSDGFFETIDRSFHVASFS